MDEEDRCAEHAVRLTAEGCWACVVAGDPEWRIDWARVYE